MQDALAAYRRRIRPIYGAVMILMLVVCGYAVALMEAMAAGYGAAVWTGRIVLIVTFPALLGFAAFLVWKPQWWAKFLLLFCGLSWTMNGAMQMLPVFNDMLGGLGDRSWIPIACGLSAFALAGVHFTLDALRPPPGRGRLV